MEIGVVSSQIALHAWLPEPELNFHATRSSDRSHHPLQGLLRFGPYSSGLIPEPIRIATLAPHGESERLYQFIRELKNSYTPRERRKYLPDWPGFHGVFDVRIVPASKNCRLELPRQIDTDFHNNL